MYKVKMSDKTSTIEPDIIIKSDSEYGTSVRIILPDETVMNILVSNDFVKIININYSK